MHDFVTITRFELNVHVDELVDQLDRRIRKAIAQDRYFTNDNVLRNAVKEKTIANYVRIRTHTLAIT